jgi:putative endonuclease
MKIDESKTNIGKSGEAIAKKYLLEKGHEILEKNFKTKYGEIDLITQYKNIIYVYEVKFRQTLTYGFGDDAINKNKIKKIYNTMQVWLNMNSSKYEFSNVYFNAIVIDPDGKINEFEVI